jgi:hypothetical protein
MLIGPAMVPGKLIPRMGMMGPYQVFFDAPTIKQIMSKYMKNKYNDVFNIEHDGKKVEGVYVTESWIAEDPEKDKAALYGFNLPQGTWYINVSLADAPAEVWNMVKEGKIKGFSVEGFFAEKLIK